MMNERINGLSKQASESTRGSDFTMEKYNAKFAELIVQECIDLFKPDPYETLAVQAGNTRVSDTIKQHFGSNL